MAVQQSAGQAPEGAAAVLARLGTQVLVCDGAMGTMLHSGGVSLDRALPELNLSQPDLVQAIHRAYIAAGAQIIETNTFGASRYRLARHGLDDRVSEINRAGVWVAHEARAQSGVASLLVAGSVAPVTPTGHHGPIPRSALRSAFREQIVPLIDAGVDLLMFETFSSLAEMIEAVEIAREIAGLPIVTQMTFVEDGRTLAGDTPGQVAATLEALDVAVLGANCVLGPQGLLEVLRELGQHTRLPLSAQPNAGPPTILDGRFRYTADPAYFARYARDFVSVGAALVGGCCGTTPAHIEAVVAAVNGLAPGRHGGEETGDRRQETEEQTSSEQASRRVVGSGQSAPLSTAMEREQVPPLLPLAPHPARGGGDTGAPPTSLPSASPDPPVARERGPGGEGAPVRGFAGKLAARQFVIGCELPPPLSADAERALHDAAQLRAAGCDAVVVAPGRGTRAQVSPASLALLVQERMPDLEAILTVTTWDRSVISLQADLLGAHAFGLRHVICRTGTPPVQADYPNVAGIWDIDGLGLSQMLHGLNQGRDHHGTPLGRPTAFVIGARIHPAADDFERQVGSVRAKIAAGASFLVTPPVYDVDALGRLLDAADVGDLPVLLGVMPLQDYRHAEYLQHEVPDTAVPEALLQRMWKAGPRGAEVGQEIALELLADARARGYVHGVVVSSGNGSASELVRVLGAIER
jgi:homocysteine S-methyltransferase